MARRWTDPHEYDDVPRPIVAIGNDYPAASELAPHSHGRGQLIYAARGVIVVSTPYGAWIAPPERAVWTPAGVPHSLRTVGAATTHGLLLDADASRRLGGESIVIGVDALMRGLMTAACEIEPYYDEQGRDGLVVALLLAELERAPRLPLGAPFPTTPALARKCHAFLQEPSPRDTIDEWCAELGVGRRAFTRAFRRETGMSFVAWRQQACILVALPRLAAGEPVTSVALSLGYDSPAAFSTMFKRVLGIPPNRYGR